MSKSVWIPVLGTASVVIVAGVIAYATIERDRLFGSAGNNRENAAIEQPVDSQTSEGAGEQAETGEGVAAVDDGTPVFDLLRVEPDGSAVLSGQAPANSDVEIIDGDTVIATGKATPEGDFAIVLEEPLAKGAHELSIRAKPENGETVVSRQTGVVSIPEPGSGEQVAVLVTEPGEASRILQKPTDEADVTVSATASESVSVKPADGEGETGSAGSGQPATAGQVFIEAAEFENGRLFIAGTARAGATVNMYLGDEFLGTATVGDNGAFLFEGSTALTSGRHNVRADMLNSGGDRVAARAEVTLLHEPQTQEAETEIAATSSSPEAESETESSTGSQSQQESGADEADAADQSGEDGQSEDTAQAEAGESESAASTKTTTASGETETGDNSAENTETAASQDAETGEANVIRTGESVIIRRGDNLWQVARRNYGAGIRYTTIFEANRDQIRNPDLIYPGQVLKVPESAADADTDSEG